MVKRVYSYSKKTQVLSCHCTYGTYVMVLTFNFQLQSLTAARVSVCPIQWYRNEVFRFLDYATSVDRRRFSDDTLDLFDDFE